MTAMLLSASMLFFASEAKASPAPEKTPSAKSKKQINLGPVEVNGETQRAVQVVIPRDSSIRKEMESASDHLLDSTQRR
jgi:hypothetical protein